MGVVNLSKDNFMYLPTWKQSIIIEHKDGEPVRGRASFGTTEFFYHRLMQFLKARDHRILNPFRDSATVVYDTRNVKYKTTVRLLNIKFLNPLTDDTDIRFTLLENTNTHPNLYTPKSTFLLSENMYMGLLLLSSLADMYYLSEGSLRRGRVKFQSLDLLMDEYREDLFYDCYDRIIKKYGQHNKFDEANKYLSRFDSQLPMDRYKQDEILETLTLKYDIVSYRADGSVDGYATLDSALRHTNYITTYVTHSRRSVRYWGSIYLVKRMPDEIIDYYKERDLDIIDFLVGREVLGRERMSKEFIKGYNKPKHEYRKSISRDTEPYKKYFGDNYGSLDNFLSSNTSRDRRKNEVEVSDE